MGFETISKVAVETVKVAAKEIVPEAADGAKSVLIDFLKEKGFEIAGDVISELSKPIIEKGKSSLENKLNKNVEANSKDKISDVAKNGFTDEKAEPNEVSPQIERKDDRQATTLDDKFNERLSESGLDDKRTYSKETSASEGQKITDSNELRNAESPKSSDNNIEIKRSSELISEEKPLHYEKSFIPRTGGEWSGEPGNSNWYPDKDSEPGDRNGTNPEHKTWEEILDKYGIDSIPFVGGEPDFSEVSKGTVEIDDFSDDRDDNFTQADEKLAEQRGCTPEEVAEWRKENGYTWHECRDCKTMQKVPTEVHGNIPHSGGVSEYKSQQNNS